MTTQPAGLTEDSHQVGSVLLGLLINEMLGKYIFFIRCLLDKHLAGCLTGYPCQQIGRGLSMVINAHTYWILTKWLPRDQCSQEEKVDNYRPYLRRHA